MARNRSREPMDENVEDDEPMYVISIAARLVGMHQQTLRYYERAGLIEPKRTGGTDDPVNCVTACAVCNSMKGGFDPSPDCPVTPETFDSVVATARAYISDKREGTTPCTYVRDYAYWLKESGRTT